MFARKVFWGMIVPAIFMISLGCAKNTVDAETVLGMLLGENFDLALDIMEADLVIVNTCGFIESARDEAYSVIDECLDAKRRSGGRFRVAAMGCLAERSGADLAGRFPDGDTRMPPRTTPARPGRRSSTIPTTPMPTSASSTRSSRRNPPPHRT